MHSSELDDKYDPEQLATGKQGSHVPCFVYTTLAHFMHVRWLRKKRRVFFDLSVISISLMPHNGPENGTVTKKK